MIQRKAKRLDQMQRRFCGQTKATDVACVWRYLRTNQDDVKHLLFLFRCVLSSSHLQSGEGEEQIKEEITLQFASDEFFQLHHICGKLSNSFARFLVGHRVVIQHPAELRLVELQLLDLRRLRFLRSELPLDWLI